MGNLVGQNWRTNSPPFLQSERAVCLSFSYWGGKLVNGENKKLQHETDWIKDLENRSHSSPLSLATRSFQVISQSVKCFDSRGSSFQWLPSLSKVVTETWASQDMLPSSHCSNRLLLGRSSATVSCLVSLLLLFYMTQLFCWVHAVILGKVVFFYVAQNVAFQTRQTNSHPFLRNCTVQTMGSKLQADKGDTDTFSCILGGYSSEQNGITDCLSHIV